MLVNKLIIFSVMKAKNIPTITLQIKNAFHYTESQKDFPL